MSELEIPYTNESAPITDVMDAARELPSEERGVAREITRRALADGITTVGGMLDRLEQLGPDGRRALVDQARVATGRPTIGQEEAQAHMQTHGSHPPRPVDWRNMHELATPEELEEIQREQERRRQRNAKLEEEQRRQAEQARQAAEQQAQAQWSDYAFSPERTEGFRG